MTPSTLTAGDKVVTELDDVDTVIFCTGYKENADMLHKSCYCLSDEEFEAYWNGVDDRVLQLPDDWKMANNAMTNLVGDVAPYNHLKFGSYASPYSYRDVVWVQNPNLMYLYGGNFDAPLLASK